MNEVTTGSVGALSVSELQQAAGFLHAATRLVERLDARQRAPSIYPPRAGLRLVIDNTTNNGGPP
ncbi:MAG TPA: hypothetical protein VFB37_01145 [Steroidobacteraceae bacterium]|nr:hypothetical protein [Steroidobacteraceae bacterium]